ncbi:unnamed protein product [Cuscuta epithymum]|uniref:GDSL esterase/lipase At5g03610-like n=1 Tax=Cuscuta epithymum TaxID=186058 RepID=A0AAV0GLU3_9ASTE|nr:unnamed protein product [Cuscuta epithymum]
MEKEARLSSAFFLCLLTLLPVAEVYNGEKIEVSSSSRTKLFVFGDSYADTGNSPDTDDCWKEPYGTTFPGRPAGRFSDGRVLTDFIAQYMGIKSPVPYRRWQFGDTDLHKNGLNFAYGGTAVFTTHLGGPNMTTQIDSFQQLIEQNVYTKHELQTTSVAHVSAAGNDYSNFGSQKDLTTFIKSIVSQLVLNLKRIYELGVMKISVVAVPPYGCLPNVNSPNVSIDTINSISRLHNELLKKAVEKLNNELVGDQPIFVILDLYSAFMSALNTRDNRTGKSQFENMSEACCRGTTSEYRCGHVDEDGTKRYVVCKDPKRAFFWDGIHPTQQGWISAFSNLTSSLRILLVSHGRSSHAVF